MTATPGTQKKLNYGMIMAVYLFGIFMGALDTGIVTPARTIIQNNLNVDDKTGIWIITIYTLAYAASIPVMGKLADRFGRKTIYILSIVLFGAGSLFCGLAQNFESFGFLLAARTVQAIGGGGIMPVATAEFGTIFPKEKQGMALGLVGGVYGVANIFGSSAGSAILDLFGKDNWQFIFYVNVPISLFVIIAGLIYLPNTKVENVKKIDVFGILLLVMMVLSLLYGLKNIDFFNFSETIRETDVYPFLLAFLVLIPIFIFVEKRAEDPAMNLSYFRNTRILVTMAVAIVSGILLMGMVFVPQFAENAMKVPTGDGGYFVIILGLFAGVGAPVSGKLTDRIGAKLVLMGGFFLSVIGSLVVMFVAISYPSYFSVLTALMLTGLGIGFTMGAPLNYMMLSNTKKEESATALATLSLVRSVGTTVAPAIMVAFLAHAGGNLQGNLMDVLPKEVSVPPLPYSQELTDEFTKLKSDPNYKDKLADVEMPDLTSMTTVKVSMDGNGSVKIPDDVLELLKTSDVTNITLRTKTFASRMFDLTTPSVITKIQSGVQTGIDSVQTASADMNKSLNDMKKAQEGIATGISQMEKAVSGIDSGLNGVTQAISQQKKALTSMNAMYTKMSDAMAAMPSAAMTSGTASGTPSAAMMSKTSSGMPSAAMMSKTGSGMPSGAMTSGTATGMPSGAMTGGTASGMPSGAMTGGAASKMPSGAMTSGKTMNLMDMIPASVKSQIPQNVLDQLKDVKTPADMKAKIDSLEGAIQTLTQKQAQMKAQKNTLKENIRDMTQKKESMAKAISGMTSGLDEMNATVKKMQTLKEAVPTAFEQGKQNYLDEIQKRSDKIESTYQSTLNEGFRQIYLTTSIFAAVALLLLLCYREKKKLSQQTESQQAE
jgi:EmrB/QacA subfamily drug resistance transporter